MGASCQYCQQGVKKMKNKLSDLNNLLFETLERLNDEQIDNDKNLRMEVERARTVATVGTTIINCQRLDFELEIKKKRLENEQQKDNE